MSSQSKDRPDYIKFVSPIIAIVMFIFGMVSAILYMRWQGEHNTETIQENSALFKERVKVVDQRFDRQEDKLNAANEKLTGLVARMDAQDKASDTIKENQRMILDQVQQVQTQLTALTATLLRKEQTAESHNPTVSCASYRAYQ